MDPRGDGRAPAPGGGFDLEELLANVQKFQREVAGSSQRLALEMADAWSRDDLVHIWVNAQGVIVQAELDESAFATAKASDVGAAIVEAAQAAQTAMRGKVTTFQSGLWQRLSGLAPAEFSKFPDVEEIRSVQPTVPVSPPGSAERQRRAAALTGSDGSMAPRPMSVDGDPDGNDGWDFTLRG